MQSASVGIKSIMKFAEQQDLGKGVQELSRISLAGLVIPGPSTFVKAF